MKSYRLPLFILSLIALSAACTKEYTRVRVPANYNRDTAITSDEAADMVATTLAANSNGLSSAASDVMLKAQFFNTNHVACGTTVSDTVSNQNPSGSTTSSSYKSIYHYTLLCNGSSQPDSASSNLTYSGSFSNATLSSTNSGSSNFTLGGLLSTAANYTLNGEYKRGGTFTSKTSTGTVSDTSNVDVVFKNITISKRNSLITGGTDNITVTGNTAQKGSFNYTGTLVYNGDGTGTLTLNGSTYLVNLVSGAVRKE